MDLRKVHHVSRVTLEPTAVVGASRVEEIGGSVSLYRADHHDPEPAAGSRDGCDRDCEQGIFAGRCAGRLLYDWPAEVFTALAIT
jgi:hypothetical protein